MQSSDLRERYLSFFAARGHTRVPSDSLIPSGDPTVLFTSAGMNQFKDCFLGKRSDLKRAASCQKCLRTGDLERVGKSASHHSFFEMLGNFSFGDYFKQEAIAWAWEFLTGTLDYAGTPSPDATTQCLALSKEQLWISIYEEDKDAFKLWRALGVPADRIKRFGQADNFWPANAPTEGPNGPCGPCSEIYFDPTGAVHGPASVEIWNLVFTQFDRQPDGSLKPLPKPNIDTGMGFERLTRVLQGVETDYETDLFAPIISAIRRLRRGTRVKQEQAVFAERAIADHLRAIVFLLGEGLVPSNESRGYILRMLIRRAHRLGRTALDIDRDRAPAFLSSLAASIEAAMRGSPYAKELAQKRDYIARAIQREEEQFTETLDAGTSRLEELIRQTPKGGMIPGEEAFRLYDTYGFPLELTVDIAQEQGLTVDRAGFEQALKVQQERSRAKSQFGGEVFAVDTLKVRETIKDLPAKEAQFIGYEALRGEGVLKGIWDGHRWVTDASAGQSVGLVLDHSPFYGEAGGQVGDRGMIEGLKGAAAIGNTTWVEDVLVHHARVSQGTLKVQEPVKAQVSPAWRGSVARSHTATHLLHWALRKVLGPEAVQAGSYVESDRIRFDFSSLSGLRDEQRHEVEALVNARVRLVDEVMTQQMVLAQAKEAGALALFGEKYGGTVRVVTIGDYSKELCGGTHVRHTGFVGSFLIAGESSIAAGTRRIEALVGDAAAGRQQQAQRLLHEAARRLGRPAEEIVTGLEELLEQLKRSEQGRKALQHELAKVQAGRLVAEAKRINGVTLVTSTIKHADRELLSVLADAIKGALTGDGVIVLASSDGPSQVSLVMATTGAIGARLHAGQLLKAIAPLTKGSGGGRPEFAQAGGKDPSGIPAALARAEELVREALAA